MFSHLLGGEIALVRIHLFDHNLDLQTSNKYRRSIFLFSHTRGLSVLLDHHKGPSAKNRSKWAPMICTSSSNVLKIVQNEQKQCIRNYPCFYLNFFIFSEEISTNWSHITTQHRDLFKNTIYSVTRGAFTTLQ